MTSSCGVCGKSAIEEILINNDFTPINSHLTLTSSQIFSLKDKVLSRQKLFADTGGIHAAALFNAHVDLIRVCEDVGRHNALDKLGGYYFKEKALPLSKNILFLSGRISFELVQKAGMLGIPIIIAVGAPSSLAVELAEEQNQTLVGFLKKDSFNIYTHNERIKA